jgi:hypothetical protein
MGLDFTGGPKIGAGVAFGSGPKFAAAPDPLAAVEYTGDLAADSGAELSAMQSAYRDRAKAEADRFTRATDSEFWFAVCFTSREEKEAFLQEFGLIRLGDKYIDGRDAAKTLRRQS